MSSMSLLVCAQISLCVCVASVHLYWFYILFFLFFWSCSRSPIMESVRCVRHIAAPEASGFQFVVVSVRPSRSVCPSKRSLLVVSLLPFISFCRRLAVLAAESSNEQNVTNQTRSVGIPIKMSILYVVEFSWK